MSSRTTRAAARVAGAALSLHAAPALSSLPLVRRALPPLAGRGRPDHVALTFDDGPGPTSTPRLLATLADLEVHATFFVLGEHVRERPDLVRDIAAAGHEVAVHGWSHAILLGRPLPLVRRDLLRTRAAIEAATGEPPRWFRPPYGVLTGDALLAARLVGLRPVLWSAWGADWRPDATAGSVAATARTGLRGGDTLLLHETDAAGGPGAGHATLDALPDIVASCHREHLDVGPLRDHALAPTGRSTACAPRPSRPTSASPISRRRGASTATTSA